jgi:hypothetical protein
MEWYRPPQWVTGTAEWMWGRSRTLAGTTVQLRMSSGQHGVAGVLDYPWAQGPPATVVRAIRKAQTSLLTTHNDPAAAWDGDVKRLKRGIYHRVHPVGYKALSDMWAKTDAKGEENDPVLFSRRSGRLDMVADWTRSGLESPAVPSCWATEAADYIIYVLLLNTLCTAEQPRIKQRGPGLPAQDLLSKIPDWLQSQYDQPGHTSLVEVYILNPKP